MLSLLNVFVKFCLFSDIKRLKPLHCSYIAAFPLFIKKNMTSNFIHLFIERFLTLFIFYFFDELA